MVLAIAGATLAGCGSANGETNTEGGTETESEADGSTETDYGMGLIEADGLNYAEANEVLYLDGVYYEEIDGVLHYFSEDGTFLGTQDYMNYLAELSNEENLAAETEAEAEVWKEVGALYTEGLDRPYVCFDADIADSDAQALVDAYVYSEEASDVLYIIQYGVVQPISVYEFDFAISSYIPVEENVYDGNYEFTMDVLLEYDEACDLIESSGLVAGDGEMYHIDADSNVSVIERLQ